jgi:hypothetical protein
MKAVWLILASAVALMPAPAQNVPLSALGTSDARAMKVIDDAVAALGGQKFLTMEDRVETGRVYSFYRQQISGFDRAHIYTRYVTVAEGKTGQELGVLERDAFGKNEDSYTLFRENRGWDVNFHGARELPKDQFTRYRDTTLHNILYILRVRLHEPGLILESHGADVVEGHPVNIVNITDAENRVVTVDFDQDSKLPIRQSWYHLDPTYKDRDEEVTHFARYGDAGGIQWPHEITRERNGEKIYQMFSESIAINQDLTSDLFEVPTGPPGKIKKK